jgi:hypothetical protein
MENPVVSLKYKYCSLQTEHKLWCYRKGYAIRTVSNKQKLHYKGIKCVKLHLLRNR